MATCIAEGRKVHKDLEIAKRQIEDLKIQLQHYVAEVKRTEDLISQKVDIVSDSHKSIHKLFCRNLKEMNFWINLEI